MDLLINHYYDYYDYYYYYIISLVSVVSLVSGFSTCPSKQLNCAAYYRTISEQKRKLMTCRFFTINKMAKAIHVEVLKIIQYTIKRSK